MSCSPCSPSATRGIGIAETEHEKVFDRFYRVRETAVSHPGTGIGRANVKHLLEEQNGRIEVTSQVGEGSEFRVVLCPGRADDPSRDGR